MITAMKIRILTISLMVSVASGLVGFPTQTYAQVFNLNQIASSTQSNPYFGIIMGDGIGSHKAVASGTPTVAGIVATSSTASRFANATSTLFTATTAWITNLFIGADTIAEYISDTVGAMFSGNTETDITITYDDSDNTIDAVVDTLPNLTGTLDVDSGGTGAATLTGLLQGNGTSAITGISNSSTVGQVLRVTGASTYAWGALDLSDTDAITGDLPFGNLTQGAANTVLANITGGTADFAAVATSSLFAGTNGQVLARVAGAWQGVATTTFSSGLTYSNGNVTADLGTSIVVGELASADFGDWTCNGTTCTIDANSVALTTDTTGNYVETVSSSGSITVGGSGAEDADVTVNLNMGNANTWTALQTFANASSTLFSSAYASSTVWRGGGLTTDCDSDNQALGWDLTTGQFVCGDDDSGAGGGITTIQENDSDVTTSATTIDFGSGFDVSGASVEGDISLDLVEYNGAASTTLLTANYASSTSYFGAGLGACSSNQWLTWASGKFACTSLVTSGDWTGTIDGNDFAGGAIGQGDILYGSAAGTISELAKDTNATRYISNTGTSNNPAWSQINLANGVSGTLPIGNGGTGTTTTAAGYAAYWGSSSLLGTPTTTVSCSGTASCTSFVVFGSTPITITGSASGGGADFSYNQDNGFGITGSATSTNVKFTAGIHASSTSQFSNATSTLLTATTAWLTNLFIGADTIAEYISDTAGAMWTGNTETDITITYDDSDNTIDAVVDTLPNLTGTLDIDSGGTGTTTSAAGYAAYWGTSAILGTPTTTASCTTGVSCTSFNVFGSSPISITATLGTSVDLTSEVTGDLPFANLAQVSANSVLGNITGSTADATSVATSSLFTWSSAFSTTGTIKNVVDKSFTISTTTAWTGSTTKAIMNPTIATTITGFRCRSFTGFGSPSAGGTINFVIGNYTSSTTMATASSTNNFNATSLSVAAGDTLYVTAGTPGSSPTSMNCTLRTET